MPQFSANIGFLWPELSLIDRIHAARRAGFSAVECHFPYDINPADVRAALAEAGLSMLSLNTEHGDISRGEYGLAGVPGRDADARAGIDKAIDYARAIDARYVHVMAGTAGDSDDAFNTYIGNIAYAGTEAGKHDIGVIIEPINHVDRPGYTLNTVDQAIYVAHTLRERDSSLDNVRIMFDCYHVQITEGNLAERLRAALPYLAHIQIAAVPGRAEPDQGEINYPWLFDLFDELGYTGYVGAEYIPAATTDAGLGWFDPYRDRSQSQQPNVVYNGMSQSKLDAEYNNTEKVENAADHLVWYGASSEHTRQVMGSELNILYGSSNDETLDLFFPNGESGGPAARPVHVFFHGGYWRALHKDDFSFVANLLSGSNGICAVVNYALVPAVSFDELVAQCRRAMVWLWQNIADYGGNPHRLTISGHSAGGHLVGMMMSTDWPKQHHLCPSDLVKGGVSLSGLMDLEPIRLCFLNETLGLTPEVAKRNSPIHLSNRGRGELTCYYGKLEGAEYRKQSEDLAAKWARTDARGLANHDHFSIARELISPDSEISRRIRRQMGM